MSKGGKTTVRLFIPFSFYNYRMSQLSCYNLAERQPFLLASSKQSCKRPTTKTHEKQSHKDTQNGVPQVNFSSVCPESEAPSLLFIHSTVVVFNFCLIFFFLFWKIESKLSSDDVSSHTQWSGLALRPHSPGSITLIRLMK